MRSVPPFAVALALIAAGCGPETAAPLRLVGVWHAVAPGDTAASIAAAHGADPAVVAELNDLPRQGPVADRAEVFVPTAKGAPPGTGAAPSAPKPAATAAAASGGCDPAGGACLAWPAQGDLAARFGERDGAPHDGIDIVAPKGAPVLAAAAGRVVYSGDGIKGYGNMILIKHEGGLITVYAHNDANRVQDGDTVASGQEIAAVGQSGNATAPHLHFEVRKGEAPADPLRYLPAKERGE